MSDVVDLATKFDLFSERWSRRVVARLDDGEGKALPLEPAGVINTGDAGGDLTAAVTEI